MGRSSVALLRPAMLGMLLVAATAVPALGSPDRAPAATPPSVAAPGAGPTNRQLVTHGSGNRLSNDRRPSRRVIVNQLPKNAHPAPLYQPKLRSATTTTTSNGTAPRAPGDEVPTQTTVMTTNPVSEAVSGPGTGDPALAGIEPADPWVAAGPDTIVQSTNVGFRMTDRSLGTVKDVALQDFFGITAIGNGYVAASFDPRVVYDSLHGRWVAIEAGFDCYEDAANGVTVGTGYIDLAVSDSADPRLGWSIISIPFTDALPDYPGLGTSTDKVVVSSNLYTLVANANSNPDINCEPAMSLDGTEIDILGWAQLLGTGPLDVGYFSSLDLNPKMLATDFTFRPAVQMPAATTTVHGIVSRNSGNSVGHFTVTGLPSGTTTLTITTLSQAMIGGFSLSVPQPIQPGPPATITDAVDGRPTDAIWQNNRLIFTSTAACDPAGGAVETRDCVRVSELNTATSVPTLAQDFLIAEDGTDNYMAGIGLSGNSDLHVVWTRSSATAGDFPSTWAAYQLKGAAASSLTGKVKISAGTSAYSGTRWGDYVGVAQDPQVADAVWSGAEYAGDGGDWATEVSQLRTFSGASYHPITPQRTLDTRIAVGLSSAFVANVPRSFSVAGVSIGGVVGVPSNAIAVTGNVTVVKQTMAGYVAVTPNRTVNPTSSTINFPTGDVRANNFSLPLGAGGKLWAVYKAGLGKTTDLVVDITGYFVAGTGEATFHPLTVPARIIDSRPPGTGLAGQFDQGVPRTLVVRGLGGVPADATVTAITGNLTVVGQTKAGYLSVTPEVPVGVPPTSNLNFPLGDVRANGLTADLNDSGALSITYTAAAGATANVILDVTGYYTTNDPTGLLFYPLNPGRIMDTRSSILSGGVAGMLTANVYKTLDTDGHWGVPAGAAGITGNLTVVGQTQAGYLADTPTAPPPGPAVGISILNFPVGDIRANGITVPLGSGDQYVVYRAGAGQKSHAILDVTGYFK